MIRPVELRDIPDIICHVAAVDDESPRHRDMTTDYVYLRSSLEALIRSPAFVGVIDSAGRGVSFGLVAPDWVSPDPIALQLFMHVMPENRGFLSYRILKAFCEAAKAAGALELRVEASMLVSTDAFGRLVQHAGFKPQGMAYYKTL